MKVAAKTGGAAAAAAAAALRYATPLDAAEQGKILVQAWERESKADERGRGGTGRVREGNTHTESVRGP